MQASFKREGRGGLAFGLEPLRRWERTDVALAASGYRHLGRWTASAQIGLTPKADFYYRRSLEGEMARRVVGTWVVHAGYRWLSFPGATVQVLTPAVSYYAARGELQARGYLSRNATVGSRGGALLLRGEWQASPAVRLTGGVAVGERIFDVVSLSGQPAAGFVAFTGARFRMTSRDVLGVDVRLAHEQPSFREAALGLSYRRSL
jgi:YaiO family outer membrane protein